MGPDAARREVVTLFEEQGPAVYRFAMLLLRQQADAEDVVQETFIKLLDHLAAGGARTNLRGWLFTVAANGCRDRMRRRFRWIPWTDRHDVVVDPPSLPDEAGRLKSARQALARLSARDRMLLALRAQGLTYAEIAAAAGLRPTSVGRLLARALSRWERALSESTGLSHAYGGTSS